MAAPGGVVVEIKGEGNGLADPLGDEAVETRFGVESVAQEVFVGGNGGGGLALVLGEFADEGEDFGDVGGYCWSNFEVGHGCGLLPRVVGGGVGIGGEPLVEGDVEVEEFLRAVDGVDHFDVELGVFEGGIVEVLDVVEEVAGECGVRFDHGTLKAEVVIVLGDLLVDGGTFDWDGDQRDADGLGAFVGEEAAVDLILGGGGNLVVGG